MKNLTTEFGLDAPGIFRGFCVGFALSCASAAFSLLASWPVFVTAATGFIATYCFAMVCMMMYGSYFWKIKETKKILDLFKWSGTEKVLDLGCGSGLMLVCAAKKLNQGTATGIDLWVAKDQSENSILRTQQNAKRHHVAAKIQIVTGDIRRLPFGDETFDVVTSHWVIHNLTDKAHRKLAMEEATRVLKSGGKLVLADIANHSEYEALLTHLNLHKETELKSGAYPQLAWALSFGSFYPTSQIWTKPAQNIPESTTL